MPSLRCCSFLLCLLGLCCAGSRAQKQDANFATDEEIKLLLTQTDRAIQQYKPLLDVEEKLFGKDGEEAVTKDRQVVNGIEMAIKAFGKNPQAFNGPLGFTFFEWLDDVDRNALLCASGAATESVVSMLAGDKDKSETQIHLSNSCLDVSTLIYTVSENAGALYARYIDGEEKLAQQGYDVAQKCTELLKKSGIKPK
jgi:hypothetical protein